MLLLLEAPLRAKFSRLYRRTSVRGEGREGEYAIVRVGARRVRVRRKGLHFFDLLRVARKEVREDRAQEEKAM